MVELISHLLNNKSQLDDLTKKFVKKCKSYCDESYFPQVMCELDKSNNKRILAKLPIWYIRCFIIKSLRLFSGQKKIVLIYKEFFQISYRFLKYSNLQYIILVLEAFLHLLYLQIKIFKNKFSL